MFSVTVHSAAAEAIAVIRGIASGLRYAAGRGLIHRDIKPSNLLRTPSGEPKIIDLGLALQSGFEDERVTREGTTVGTVDYMAPEQARDSRATSSLSDIYSLGCTFYYLLAGVPPFPGGDITDKLTRHARTPAPDIRDLRPDIPAGLARILLRMMAKQPEDRFAGYDELIAALDSVSLEESGGANGIALMPLDEDESAEEIQPGPETGGARNGTRSLWDVVDEDGLALESATGMSLDLADEREAARPRPVASEAAAPLPRLGQSSPPDEPVFLEDEAEPESETVLAARTARSAPTWILASGGIGAVAILLAIVLLRMFGGPGAAGLTSEDIPEPDAEATDRVAVVRPTPSAVFDTTSRRDRTKRSTASGTTSRPRPEARKPDWVEPEDVAPEPGDATAPSSDLKEARSHLPEWARGPVADGQEGPVWVVRRVADAGEGQTEPTLHYALDQHIGGTVELGDEGPFPVDDLRMSGESRHDPRPSRLPADHPDRAFPDGECTRADRVPAPRPQNAGPRGGRYHRRCERPLRAAVGAFRVLGQQPDATRLHDHGPQPDRPSVRPGPTGPFGATLADPTGTDPCPRCVRSGRGADGRLGGPRAGRDGRPGRTGAGRQGDGGWTRARSPASTSRAPSSPARGPSSRAIWPARRPRPGGSPSGRTTRHSDGSRGRGSRVSSR